MDWQWRFGVLHGLGECVWQEMGEPLRIRRITKVMVAPNGGMGFMKWVGAVINRDSDEIDGTGVIVISMPAPEALIQEMSRLWSAIQIPTNGSRLKLS